MSNAVIGALRVVLGMDSAAFNDGVGAAQKRVAAFRKSMERCRAAVDPCGHAHVGRLDRPSGWPGL